MVRRRRRIVDQEKKEVDLGLGQLLSGQSEDSMSASNSEPILSEDSVKDAATSQYGSVSKFSQLAEQEKWQELCALTEVEMESATPGSVSLLEARLWWIKSQRALSGIPIGILLAPLLAVIRAILDLKAVQARHAKDIGLIDLALDLNQALSKLLADKGDLEAVETLRHLAVELSKDDRYSLQQGQEEGGQNTSADFVIKSDSKESFDKPHYVQVDSARSNEARTSSSLKSFLLIVLFALMLSAGVGLVIYHAGYIFVAGDGSGIVAKEPSAISWQHQGSLNAPVLERKPALEQPAEDVEPDVTEPELSSELEDVQVVAPRLPVSQNGDEPEKVLVNEGDAEAADGGLPEKEDVTEDVQSDNRQELITSADAAEQAGPETTERREESPDVSDEIPSGPERHYRIIAKTLVRSQPTFRALPIDTLYNGDRVIVVGRRGVWLKLRSVKGKSGYIVIDDAAPLATQ